MRAAKISLSTARYFSLFYYLAGSVLVVWLSSTGLFSNVALFQNRIVEASTTGSEIPFNQMVITQSQFTQKIQTATTPISFPIKYVNDDNLDFGKTQVLQEGIDGKTVSKIKITYHENQEFAKEQEITEIIQPVEKIVARGTKKVILPIDTPHGKFNYFAKLNVFATSYDKNCRGCNETTATGAKVGHGIVAVDPKVIPMGTKLYIPGYGIGVAADTGGAIKGNVIDLAFEDVRSGWWSSRRTDIYLLAQ